MIFNNHYYTPPVRVLSSRETDSKTIVSNLLIKHEESEFIMTIIIRPLRYE